MRTGAEIEQHLRSSLRARADSFVLTNPSEPPDHIVGVRKQGRARYWALVGVAAAILTVAGFVLSDTGGHTSSHHSLADRAATGRSPSSNAKGSRTPSRGGGESIPAPIPPPCAPNVTIPTDASGRYCGPIPPAGNGLGPDGACTGTEVTVPCGAGVTIGQYYAFTVPGGCDGLIIFDGQRWVSELAPSTPVPDFYVWMRLDADGTLRYISPTGSVGFNPYSGQTLNQCSGTTTPPTP